MRVLISVALALGVAFASYGAAATVIVSSAIDPDLRCDPDEVIVGWSIAPGLADVDAVELTQIDPDCVGAELYVLVMQDGAPLADASFIVNPAQTGSNVAGVPLTTIGAATTPVVLPITSVTGVSVLMHRGSEPATGSSDLPCELLGLRIEGWGVELLSAMVSSVRLVDVNPECIGNELVLELDQDGTVIADGRVVLTAGNTGSNIVTVVLTPPGASTAPISLHATVITGINVYVEADVPDEQEPPVGEGPDNDAGPQGVINIPVSLTDEVQGTQLIPSEPEPALVDEIGGVRQLPSTGSGGLLGPNAQRQFAIHAAIAAVVFAVTFIALGVRKSQTDRRRGE